MPHIASTMSASVDYAIYEQRPSGGANPPKEIITVKGGANVTQRRDGGIIMPEGVITQVTEGQLNKLMQHDMFTEHMKRGFVKVFNSKTTVEKAVSDMTKKDVSAPYSVSDYSKGGRAYEAGMTPLRTTKE